MRLRRLRAAVTFLAILAPPVLALPAGAPVTAAAAPGEAAAVTAGTGPVSVALVVPLTMPPGETGLLDAQTLATSTAPTGALNRQLDELLALPQVNIGLDPMIPASIRALGSAAPASAREWLARLQAAPNEIFLLGYADADLAALAAADSIGLGTPLSLDFALDPDNFGPAVTPTPSESAPDPEPGATPSEEPAIVDPVDGTPPLPTTADLLAWAGALPGIAWPADDTVDAATLPAFAAAGYTHVVLSSTNISPASSGLVELGDVDGLVSDAGISELTRHATLAIADDERQASLASLITALDDLADSSPGRTLLVTLTRHWPLGVFRLADVAATIETASSSQLIGVSSVIGGPSAAATVIAPIPDEERVGRIGAMLESDNDVAAFATILTNPVPLLAPRRLELLALLSLSWLHNGDWDAASATFLDAGREILASVQVVQGSTLQVISSTTNLRIAVSNALDFPVTVRVEARPLRPLIRIDGPVEVTVEPGSSKTAIIPAQAITNGQVSLQVTLVSPTNGRQIGSSQLLQVNLQAQWETVGILLGGVIALIFAVGIARNIVKRRREAKLRTEDDGEDG